ncbi:phospholipase A2, membrane associated-like [Lissotriton helveticus]
MKAAFLLAVFTGCLCLVAHGDIPHFGLMILAVTGKNPLTDYGEYGCFCGVGGYGQPVDATDWCCQKHDCCYAKLEQSGCHPKADPYEFSVSNGNVACGRSLSDCGRQVCECDKTAVLCFKANLDTYDPKLATKINLTCKGSKPAC